VKTTVEPFFALALLNVNEYSVATTLTLTVAELCVLAADAGPITASAARAESKRAMRMRKRIDPPS
jgi:hypothetical protein